MGFNWPRDWCIRPSSGRNIGSTINNSNNGTNDFAKCIPSYGSVASGVGIIVLLQELMTAVDRLIVFNNGCDRWVYRFDK